ncbi:metallophosphoesterase [Candidatus Woesearchaeota archaeon]|nr:metallophosphoesterase [Candidatus Woesearchaeota archaeon]
MRILAFSDTHGDMKKIREFAEKSDKENVDLVVMCGDFTYFDELPPYLIKPFKDLGKKIVIIPGNHETKQTADFLASFYGISNVDGKYVVYDDVAFFGCGGANMPTNMVSDNGLIYTLRETNRKIKNVKKKVMLTHLHPSGLKMDKVLPNSGSKGLRRIVEEIQPDLLICGHIHEASGTEDFIGKTRVINVARTSKIIEV